MKFYISGKAPRKIKTEKGFKEMFKQCEFLYAFQKEEKFIHNEIFCKNCKRLLVDYIQPVGREDVMIDAYWHIYLPTFKRFYCKDCKKRYYVNVDIKVYKCPQCKKKIKDYRAEENLCVDGLLAYIVRKDGNLGLECSCGSDTRESTCKDSRKADFKNTNSLFVKTERSINGI